MCLFGETRGGLAATGWEGNTEAADAYNFDGQECGPLSWLDPNYSYLSAL